MLERILSDARIRSEAAAAESTALVEAAGRSQPARGFSAALAQPGLSVIAEVKRRSPSRGVLAAGLDAAAQASIYEDAGATAVSVLTEPLHFDGSLDDLIAVQGAVGIPVLRKYFVLDPAQVFEARAAGADAVLLIVAALGADLLGRMITAAAEARIDALVEVHDREEAAIARAAGATLIGVNNRNLETFVTDLGVAEALASVVQGDGVVTVAESGIHTTEDAERMRNAGYDAILVGEALVVADDPASWLSRLVGPS
ncbi:MAG: indole-3-glycerol phosphate synthase TrpC [Acidimicrobiia bacterium]